MSPACVDVAVKAADAAGFGRDNVFLVEGKIDGFATLQELVEVGKNYGNDGQVEVFKIPPGKKNGDICGYLSFSSGHDIAPNHDRAGLPNVQITEPDHKRVLGVLPSFHIMGLVHILHLPLIINAEVLFLPEFSLQSMLSTTAEYRISELLLMPPPPHHHAAGAQPGAARAVRPLLRQGLLVRRGAAVRRVLAQQQKRFPGSGFKQGYGLTESTSCNTARPPHLADLAHVHTVGTILAGTEVKIVCIVEDDAADDKRDDDVAVMGVPPVADDDYAGEPP
ncbi:hypothetical protein JOL62DRAFT_608687 [Phyllosticta paracitricarpa]